MEREEKSMETISAVVQCLEEKHFIKIGDEEEISIPISEDNAKAVKNAFNKLIIRLKNGPFEIELKEIGEDLFSQVANEYINQLNRELQEVYGEMEQFGLVEDDAIDL